VALTAVADRSPRRCRATFSVSQRPPLSPSNPSRPTCRTSRQRDRKLEHGVDEHEQRDGHLRYSRRRDDDAAMFELDHTGKVDRAVAPFNDSSRRVPAPCTTVGWTFTSGPGGGALNTS